MATTNEGFEGEERKRQNASSEELGQRNHESVHTNRSRSRDAGRAAWLRNVDEYRLARGLGWFSLGLGLTEVLAPRAVAKISGVSANHTGLIRLFGLREIASGLGIFLQDNPTASVWSRVAGDALDLTALGTALALPNGKKGRVAFTTANVLAVTALDVLCAQKLSSESTKSNTWAARDAIVVNKSPEEVYAFWRDFQNFPRFMRHIESVEVGNDDRSHWVANAPAGTTVEWDAEITADQPNELISWRSLEGSQVQNSGAVTFEPAPGNRGTIVRVQIEYSPPGGAVGVIVAKLLGEDPTQQLPDDLRRFKQVVEIGEVVLSDAGLRGTGLTEQRPGRPADELPPRALGATTSFK